MIPVFSSGTGTGTGTPFYKLRERERESPFPFNFFSGTGTGTGKEPLGWHLNHRKPTFFFQERGTGTGITVPLLEIRERNGNGNGNSDSRIDSRNYSRFVFNPFCFGNPGHSKPKSDVYYTITKCVPEKKCANHHPAFST